MMALRRTFRPLIRAGFVLFLVILIVGNVLGQPILLSYVTSDSMEPTLEPGDGFVAVPTALVGPPSKGDLVVYRSAELEPGELVTHRVVDRRESGYVTRGDGNPFTDQSGGEPPVPRSRIVATALSYGGNVLVIPEVGTALLTARDSIGRVQHQLARLTGSRRVLGASGLGYLLLGIGLFSLGSTLLFESGRKISGRRVRPRSRPTISVLLVVLVLSALVAGPATAIMAVSSGEETFSFVSSASPSPNPNVVRGGTTMTGSYELTNNGIVPVVVIFESKHEGLQLDAHHTRLVPGQTFQSTITIDAPDEPGYYERTFSRRVYFALLPTAWIVALDSEHPLLALAAVDGVILVGITLLVLAIFGHRPIPIRQSSQQHTLGRRLWRLLR